MGQNVRLIFRYLKNALLFLIIFLLASELSARLFFYVRYRSPKNFLAQFGLQTNSEYGTEIIPLIRNRTLPHLATTFSTNSKGYRGKIEYGSKQPNELRILLLGESAVFGYGATSDDTSLGPQLEKNLRARLPDRPVSVINTGTPGHISFQILRRFQLKAAEEKPDVAVFYFGWNDLFSLVSAPHPRKNIFLNEENLKARSWQEWFWLFNRRFTNNPILRPLAVSSVIYKISDLLAIRNKKKNPAEAFYEKSRAALLKPEITALLREQLSENLIALSEFGRKNQIRLVGVTLFSEFDFFAEGRQIVNDILRGLAKEGRFTLLNADERVFAESLKGINNTNDYCHLTDQGNRLLAEWLAEEILQPIR